MSLPKLEIIVQALTGSRAPQEGQPQERAVQGATRTVKSMRRRKPQAGRA